MRIFCFVSKRPRQIYSKIFVDAGNAPYELKLIPSHPTPPKFPCNLIFRVLRTKKLIKGNFWLLLAEEAVPDAEKDIMVKKSLPIMQGYIVIQCFA